MGHLKNPFFAAINERYGGPGHEYIGRPLSIKNLPHVDLPESLIHWEKLQAMQEEATAAGIPVTQWCLQ